MGLTSSFIGIISNVERTFKFQYENYLGNIDDKLTVILENVRSTPGRELKLIPKPGLAGVELDGLKGTVKPKITIEVKKDGKYNKQVYRIDSSKAVRLDFSRLPFNKELKVINLNKIGGTITKIKTIGPL